MEIRIKKCSSNEHPEIDANNYCLECKIYMCNKCQNLHNKLFQNHHLNMINKENIEIFTGFCQEINHFEKLEYYCKNHNKLCCASCAVKIKGKGKGQHKDCDIIFIEDIKEEKKII